MMGTLTHTLNSWSTADLMDEVVLRAAGDAVALRSIEDVVIRARLAQVDGRSEQYALTAGPETELGPKTERRTSAERSRWRSRTSLPSRSR